MGGAVGAAWAAVATMIALAAVGAIWRVGSKLSALAADLSSLVQRVRDIGAHVEAHDAWHMDRLGNGKDTR